MPIRLVIDSFEGMQGCIPTRNASQDPEMKWCLEREGQ